MGTLSATIKNKNGKNVDKLKLIKDNPYLNRISMLIEILKSISSLTRNNKDIALKVAKHAIKTILKSVEMHILGNVNDDNDIDHVMMDDAHNKQQKKVLLMVITTFLADCMDNTSSYLIKYDICSIIYHSLQKYHDPNNEDLI